MTGTGKALVLLTMSMADVCSTDSHYVTHVPGSNYNENQRKCLQYLKGAVQCLLLGSFKMAVHFDICALDYRCIMPGPHAQVSVSISLDTSVSVFKAPAWQDHTPGFAVQKVGNFRDSADTHG